MTKYVTGGVSQNRNGTWKVRHSTLSVEDSVVRQVKAGDEHIMYVELPREMGREELPAYLLTLTEFNTNADYKAVIEATIAKKAPKPAKAKAVKAAPAKASTKVKIPSKPQSVQVDARTAELAAA
jgi:BRCT domain type II-containing protein